MNAAETAYFTDLSNQLLGRAGSDELLNRYYEGVQRLEHLGLAVPPELRRFETIVNWPRLGVDSVEERLDVEGFRLPGTDESDDDLWRVWQANDGDEQSQLGHQDSLIYGRSFVCVGANEEDENTPLITVETPREMTVQRDPRTRRIVAALRFYDVANGTPTSATLYLPNVTIWLNRGEDGRWTDDDRDEHNLGQVPVVALVNRPRAGWLTGISEMSDIIPLTDAMARTVTNLQIASETHAVPQRWALGVSKGDFVDADGAQLPVWEAYFGAVWTASNAQASFGQFNASDLRNFHETGRFYAQIVAGLTGLPGTYLGFVTENPASADAIRAAESRLIKRAERKQRFFGGSWEQVGRLVRRFQTGEWEPALANLEVLWRDPATPTKAQSADAVVKLTQGDNPVLPVEASWIELGYSATYRKRLKAMRDAQLAGVSTTTNADGEIVVTTSPDLREKADALGILIRAGASAKSAATLLGLDGLEFTGAVPVSLRLPEDEAAQLEGA